MSTTLYRLFNDRGELLYVGITDHGLVRWSQHQKSKVWWHEVKDIQVEHFGLREDALAAEKWAIGSESPRYNVAHNRGRPSAPAEPTRGKMFVRSRATGVDRQADDLCFVYQVEGSSISDNFTPGKCSPVVLWHGWVESMKKYDLTRVPIHWFIQSEMAGIFEAARGLSRWEPKDGTLHRRWVDDFDQPRYLNGAPFRWLDLPVLDQGWSRETHSSGGFIQELTGWKPSPLQPVVNALQIKHLSQPWTGGRR